MSPLYHARTRALCLSKKLATASTNRASSPWGVPSTSEYNPRRVSQNPSSIISNQNSCFNLQSSSVVSPEK